MLSVGVPHPRITRCHRSGARRLQLRRVRWLA